jgi:ubiquinone biosynthesis protein COQ9
MYQINLLINKRLSNEKKPLRFKSFRVNEKVKYFTMRRLMIFESLVDKKFFFGKIFKPNLLLNSNKILFKIADEIWFLSGDKSTDYNYYTKRIILMKVYALTFSFFIFDNSKNLERTRNFLDKEIDIVLKFGKFTNKIKKKIRF